MKKNSLTPNNGLSLSQAQSITNLCHQRAREITAQLNGVNNYSKTVDVNGKPRIIQAGKKLPTNTVDLLKSMAKLFACQAFLMENIKAKDNMIAEAKHELSDYSGITAPKRPLQELMNIDNKKIKEVDENFGWEQLTATELNEYYEAEAFAAHIGQFIHKDGLLDHLRNELPNIPAIEWLILKGDGSKSPVEILVHHTPEELMSVHEELAGLHRDYEKRVNYFKSKVKSLNTAENARIAKVNADLQNEAEAFNNKLNSDYNSDFKAYTEKIKSINAEFEIQRQAKIKEIATMRIQVDPRFQDTIDEFLKKLTANETSDSQE